MAEKVCQSNGNEGVEFATPGGWRGKIFGRSLMPVLTFILATAVFFYAIVSSKEHEAILSEMQIQTWLISLPSENRPRLIMPQGLSSRVAGDSGLRRRNSE